MRISRSDNKTPHEKVVEIVSLKPIPTIQVSFLRTWVAIQYDIVGMKFSVLHSIKYWQKIIKS